MKFSYGGAWIYEVSVRTVSRWVLGQTEPRMRDLRRVRQLFGEPLA